MKFSLIILVILFLSCKRKSNVFVTYNNDGEVSKISIVRNLNLNDSTHIVFSKGNCIEEMFSNSRNEHLYFYENGNLFMKMSKQNDTLNGLTISFTPFGTIDFFKNFYNNKNIQDAYYFHDSSTMIKKYIQYSTDSSGNYTNTVYFDKEGKVIKDYSASQ